MPRKSAENGAWSAQKGNNFDFNSMGDALHSNRERPGFLTKTVDFAVKVVVEAV